MAHNRNNSRNSSDPYLSQQTIITRYGVNKKVIDRYFPKPLVKYNPHRSYRYTRLWKQSDVEQALSIPQVQEAIAERAAQQRESAMRSDIRKLLMSYSPESMIEKGRELKRVFVLHSGPTNSGKTYDAINALKSLGCGVYLGPLRLLALEMYDKINAAGIPCSLLTGEEYVPTEGAQITASTIELCDFSRHYKVAVIDEAQLVTDSDRGASWLRAICLVDAEEVHICLAPEALGFMESLIKQFNDPYTVVEHQRLVPLQYAGRCNGFEDIRPYDAVICFSRKNVLSTAAQLERSGFNCSVIYGALPPLARRNEIAKYMSGESSVIVATDAIGMGISLPIRRVIFAETSKFDGVHQRELYSSEVRQIAGRAGRYGMFDLGEVLTMSDNDIVESGLKNAVRRVKAPCISFPRELLDTEYPIDLLMKVWQSLPPEPGFKREDMSEALMLYSVIKGIVQGKDRQLIFDLITCPVDCGSRELVGYWNACASAIIKKRRIPAPYFDTDTLMGCELQYKAYDVHHQLLRRIGRPDNCDAEREAICERIKELMAENKAQYIRRCRHCGAELPIGFVYNVCDKCRREGIY